jgi:hypothetical protein
VTHTFWEIKLGDVDKSIPYECATINGSRKTHSMSSLDHLDSQLLLICELFCFYPMHVDGGEKEGCQNISRILPFKTIRLIPIEWPITMTMLNESNFQTVWGIDGQPLVNNITQGDNFAVVASDLESGEKFFMMLCDKTLFTCREKFKDGWQNEWEAKD